MRCERGSIFGSRLAGPQPEVIRAGALRCMPVGAARAVTCGDGGGEGAAGAVAAGGRGRRGGRGAGGGLRGLEGGVRRWRRSAAEVIRSKALW